MYYLLSHLLSDTNNISSDKTKQTMETHDHMQNAQKLSALNYYCVMAKLTNAGRH